MHIHISDTIMTDVKEERFLQELDEKNYGSESNFLSLGMQIQKCSTHLYYYLFIIHTIMCFDLLQITEDLKY